MRLPAVVAVLASVLASVPSAARADERARLPSWILASVRQDFAWLDGARVCSPERQAAGEFACFRSNDTQYLGTPNPADAQRVRGLAVATTRILAGYQKFVTPALALAAWAGLAVRGGAPKPVGASAHAFLPLHLEAQLSAWPWGPPLRPGRPKAFGLIGGGLAQLDASTKLRVREDRSAAPAPSQLDNPDEQTLRVAHKAGTGFATAGLGAACALGRHWVVRGALQAVASFPAPGFGGAVDVAIAFDP